MLSFEFKNLKGSSVQKNNNPILVLNFHALFNAFFNALNRVPYVIEILSILLFDWCTVCLIEGLLYVSLDSKPVCGSSNGGVGA